MGVLLRHGLSFSRAWWTMQLISGEKDWEHVSVQKVVTLSCFKDRTRLLVFRDSLFCNVTLKFFTYVTIMEIRALTN